jgi:hypothetical protein
MVTGAHTHAGRFGGIIKKLVIQNKYGEIIVRNQQMNRIAHILVIGLIRENVGSLILTSVVKIMILMENFVNLIVKERMILVSKRSARTR